MTRWILLTVLLALTPPAAAADCAGEAWIETTLYMGRGLRDGGTVSDADLQAFVSETIVAAFPDGFTLYDARGHWRDGRTGRAAGETTLVLAVAHPPGPEADAALRGIADAYLERFGQSSVLRSDQPACVTFYEKK